MTNNFAVHALRNGNVVNAVLSGHVSHMSITIIAGGELAAIVVTEDADYARRLCEAINRAVDMPAMADDGRRVVTKAA